MTGSPCWLLVETMTGHYFVCVYIIMMLAAKYYKFFHWLVTIMGYCFLNHSITEVYIFIYTTTSSLCGVSTTEEATIQGSKSATTHLFHIVSQWNSSIVEFISVVFLCTTADTKIQCPMSFSKLNY